MKIFLAITAFVGVVVADIGITSGTAPGYHYKVPHTTYGVPSHQVGSHSNSNFGYSGINNAPYTGNTGFTGYTGSNGYKGHQGVSSGYQGNSGYQGSNFGNAYQGSAQNAGGVQYHSQSGSEYQNTASFGQNSAGANAVSHQAPNYQYSSGVSSGIGQQYQQQYQSAYQQYYKQQQQQPAQIFKHFYVHAAPEEPEQPKFRQPAVLPAPQKHYKIIFIKTPSQAAAAPQLIPVQQQNEEKTIVYVLVQKPEEAKDVVVPKIEQKPPTKPEVFFIKYSDKEGSQAVINNIVNDYNKVQDSSVHYSGLDSSSASGSSIVSGLSDTSYGLQSDGVASSGGFGHSAENGHAIALASSDSHDHGAVAGSTEGHGYNVATAEAGSIDSFNTVESSAVAQSGFSSGQANNVEGFNTVSTSQGVPHESYGVPKFRV